MTSSQLIRPSAVVKSWEAIERDRWGRPMIRQEDGSEFPYRRPSTISKVLSDTEQLKKWAMRQVAFGVSIRDDLVALAASHPEDKSVLNRVAQQAMDAAASSAGANTGTALHKILENIDMGRETVVPKDLQGDVDAYLEGLDRLGFEVVDCEQFVVNDELRVAGTYDRLYRTRKGALVVGDLKTGSELAIKYGQSEFAIQIAIYANSLLYDPDTAERIDRGVNKKFGVVAHIPARSGKCDFYKIDLSAGWEAAKAAVWAYDYRKRKDLAIEL